MAEWLCSGLQSRVPRFDSGFSLHMCASGLDLVQTFTFAQITLAVILAASAAASSIRQRQNKAYRLNLLALARPRCPGGETGRRKGLKIPRGQPRAGSIPAPGTITNH